MNFVVIGSISRKSRILRIVSVIKDEMTKYLQRKRDKYKLIKGKSIKFLIFTGVFALAFPTVLIVKQPTKFTHDICSPSHFSIAIVKCGESSDPLKQFNC